MTIHEQRSRFATHVDWGKDSKETFRDVWDALPGEIKEQFGSNGTTNKSKLAIFQAHIDALLDDDQMALRELIMMSEDCVRADGRVDLGELQRILADKNGSTDIDGLEDTDE